MGSTMSIALKGSRIGPLEVKVGDVIAVAEIGDSRLLVRRVPWGYSATGKAVTVLILDGEAKGSVDTVRIPWESVITRFDED
jgi:hypothetical protein